MSDQDLPREATNPEADAPDSATPESDPDSIEAIEAIRRLEVSEQEAAALRQAHTQLEQQLAEAQADHRAAVRRALLAEHAGQVVAELVQGSTPDELEASLGPARQAFDRIANELRQQAAAMVPMGASASAAPSPEALSPMQKITHALSRNGR